METERRNKQIIKQLISDKNRKNKQIHKIEVNNEK